MVKDRLTIIWNKLIGNKNAFSLEVRIFHSVCIILLLGIGSNVIFNYLINIPELAILMLLGFVLLSGIYYFSRFKGKLNGAITTFLIINNIVLVFNYYYNSGIAGPSYCIFVLSFLVALTITTSKYKWIWLAINIALFLGLLTYEYLNPKWISNTYHNRQSMFIDYGYTYVVVISLVLLIVSYISNAYRKEQKAVRQKAEALEISNNTRNKLLSILAHDLKEPLTSIQGFLELLTEYKLEDAERVNIEKELLERTKNTSYMLANVLAWTKRQMEAVSVNLIPLNLQQTLSNTIQVLQSIATEKGIEFKLDFQDGICVLGDRDMLQLVIRNLIINAIKFTYPGGKVTVNAKQTESNCVISVSDTGIGIPPEQQERLFSMSAKSTFGTAHEKGAGLGLVLCREFIELQGGKIWVESKLNQGSIFFISISACAIEKPQTMQSPEEMNS